MNPADNTGNIPTGVWFQWDVLRDEFEAAWRAGQEPRCEAFLDRVPEEQRPELLTQLLRIEFEHRQRSGTLLRLADYTSRFATFREVVESVWQRFDSRAVSSTSVADGGLDLTQPFQQIGSTPSSRTTPSTPPTARYRKVRQLGEGAFGAVWVAEDLELRRQVALKEPHADRLRDAADIEMYLSEARVLASLDHPHIVPVYDVGRTAEGSCYVVSKLIDGMDLAAYAQHKPLTFDEAARLVAQVAEALQHTHNRGLVHRDIKPANILVDIWGRPFVTDFGLALHEDDFGKQAGIAGTPAYMSPEQARGEGHLVDGRSDIFSLGVVLYELLTGSRPFSGNHWREFLQQITTLEATPPRQRNESIPPELERICLKALSKRAADRYPCAADLAEDLRHWSAPSAAGLQTPSAAKIVPKGLRAFDAADSDFFLELLPGPRDRDGLPETLRFWKSRLEETDPDQTFRVGLMYGPSGCGKSSLMKAGLLPRLADHVNHVFLEATPDQTETRLLQGLRRACVDLPRAESLVDTLAAIRRGKGIPAGRKLVLVLDQFEQWLYGHSAEQHTELAAALRQCDGERMQAVLLVRDDFWMPVSEFLRALEVPLLEGVNAGAVNLFDSLHARKVLAEFGKAYGRLPENLGQLSSAQEAFLNEAVSGLAQDGKVICVRLALFADMMKGRSWTPAALQEVGGTAGVGATFLEETFSSRTAPPQHQQHQEAARAVLRALLPGAGTDIKGHMRSYAELLETSEYANRQRDFAELLRILDNEVRLITPVGSEEGSLKSEGRSEKERDPTASSTSSFTLQTYYFQLTHDYLVPSLRDWLTRKQRETRRGRAEIRLEERAATWNAKPESRYLPSLWEYIQIATLTRRRDWREPQTRMMRSAGRYHATRTALLAVSLLVLGYVGFEAMARQRVRGLVDRLVSAEPAQLPAIVRELESHPSLTAAYLSPLLSKPAETPAAKNAQLHARMASVGRDPSLVTSLVEELLTGKVTYVLPIRQLLRPSAVTLTERFRDVLRDESADVQRRFRAALALADYIPVSDSASWTEQDLKFIAQQLTSSNAEFQPLLREALRPIDAKLIPNLEQVFGDTQATEAQRLSAANALADYSASDVARLSKLLAVATSEQHAVLYPVVAASRTPRTINELNQIAAKLPPDEMGSVDRIAYGQRRANAAVTLLRLGEREKLLPVFDWNDDPEALTQFIFRCRPRGVSAEPLLECLQLVSAAPKDRYPKDTRYALLLALGEFKLEEIPARRRDALLTQLADWYAHDPSSGVHGAAGWLLRQWGQAEVANRIDQTPVPYSPEREWFTLAITVQPTPLEPQEEPARESGGGESAPEQPGDTGGSHGEEGSQAEDSPATPAGDEEKGEPPAEPLPPQTFYFTFIVFPPGEYAIGSPADEPDRSPLENRETRHSVILTRPFAVLDREITMAELLAFSPQYAGYMEQLKAQPTDAGFGADWYDAVGFCRWLGEQARIPDSEQAYASPESLDQEKYPREPNPAANWAPRDWPVDLSRRGFRLPTDAEWEVASRAGARTARVYGGEVGQLDRFGWFGLNSGKHVHPPRKLRPSVRGLFDLHGNLFEWTHDWYDGFGTGTVTDPVGPPEGSGRVYRGGGWADDAVNCRTADRNANDPAYRAINCGFRLALSPSEKEKVVSDK